MKLTLVLAAALLTLFLSACGGAPAAPAAPAATAEPAVPTTVPAATSAPTTAPTMPTTAPAATAAPTTVPAATAALVAASPTAVQASVSPAVVQSAPVQYAINDLASRLNVNPADITVVRVVEVDWPNGAMGCPQPDMQYTQQLVNGTFMELEVNGQVYHYHSGGARQPFLCQSKDEVVPEDLPPELGGPDK